MSSRDSVKAIPVMGFDTAGLNPALWQDITPASGIPESVFMIAFRNYSDRLIQVSYDGINLHDMVQIDADLVLNFQQLSRPNGCVSLLRRGTHIYVRGIALGKGFLYVSGYFQDVV